MTLPPCGNDAATILKGIDRHLPVKIKLSSIKKSDPSFVD
jgi:hypothetical protein